MQKIEKEIEENNVSELDGVYLQERRTNYEIVSDIFECLNDGTAKNTKQIAKDTYSRESTVKKWVNYIIAVQNKPKINNQGYIYTMNKHNGHEIKLNGKNFTILSNIYECFESGGKWSVSKIHRKTKLHKKTIKAHLNLIQFISNMPKVFHNGNQICMSPIFNWMEFYLNSCLNNHKKIEYFTINEN